MSIHVKIPYVCSAIETAGLSIIDFRVLAHIYRRAGKDGYCYESYQNFAIYIGIHKETVSASIKRLKAAGFITGTKRLRPVDWKLMHVPAELDDAGLTPREFRAVFHVIRKECRKENLESPCFSSFNEIARATRTSRARVRSLVESVVTKGFVHKAIPRGLWSRYAKSRALNAPSAVSHRVSPAVAGRAHPTLDELDEIEALAAQPPSAPFKAPPAYWDSEQTSARGLGLLLNRVASLPLRPAFNVADFREIVKVEQTEFSGLSVEEATCATVLYGARCLADSYVGHFSDALNARDWQGAQVACFHRDALSVITLYAGLRLQALADPDGCASGKGKIEAAYRFPGQALRRLETHKNAAEARYKRDAAEAISSLEDPLPISVIGRYLVGTRDGCYESLERPHLRSTECAA